MELNFYGITLLPEVFYAVYKQFNIWIALLFVFLYFICMININFHFYISGIIQTIIGLFVLLLSFNLTISLIVSVLLLIYWIHIFRWNYYLKKLPGLYPEIFQSNLIRNKKPLSGFDFFIEKSNLANSEKNKIHEIKHKNLVYKFKYI